jgi:hypothetical protein
MAVVLEVFLLERNVTEGYISLALGSCGVAVTRGEDYCVRPHVPINSDIAMLMAPATAPVMPASRT